MTEREFFEQQNFFQKRLTIGRYQQLNSTVRKNQNVLAGSSLCEQFPINEMLQSRGLTTIVYNRGVSGDNIDGLFQYMDTLILDLEPNKLFINIGSNDIGEENYDENILFDKYTTLLSTIKSKLPNCHIHVLSYYPVNPDKESFLNAQAKAFMFATRTNDNIRKVNLRLKNHCSERGYTFIDVHTILLDNQYQLKKDFTVEGIHLWPTAYEVILDVLLPYFT